MAIKEEAVAASQRELEVAAPQPATETYDAIVIGSGMSGLTSAVILAKEGKRVLVLEKHYRFGGYMHRFFRKGGVEFDVGFHYVGAVEPGQALGVYLEYCGVRDRLNFLPLDPTGYDDLRFPGYRYVIPAGEERYRDKLCGEFPGERAAIERYVSDMRGICDGFAFYRIKVEQDLTHADRWMSIPMGEYLAGITSNERLKAVLLGQNPLYGVEPYRTPVGLHALVTDSFMQNPYALDGGGDALAGAMVDRVRELGGVVRSRRTVREILVDDERRVSGVVTERGERFHAPIVVSCAHPKATVRMLPKSVLRPGYRRRVLGMEDGPATLSVFVTTKADLSHYAGGNLYNYKSFDIDSLYDGAREEHRFVFATVPTAREGVGKGGLHQAIGLGFLPWSRVEQWQDTHTGQRGEDYEAFKLSEAQALLKLMQEVIPELDGQVETLEAATPLTNRDYASSERGAAYGIHHCVEQSGRYGLRPRTRVGGLYLTGQSVLMPGVCGVTISAFHTCSIILGAEHLIGRVRKEAV